MGAATFEGNGAARLLRCMISSYVRRLAARRWKTGVLPPHFRRLLPQRAGERMAEARASFSWAVVIALVFISNWRESAIMRTI